MLGERTMVFVWRCPDCPGVYGGESLLFLHTDGYYRYCTCGGRLVEDVAPEEERCSRLAIPSYLVGTSLHRRLEELLADEEGVELTSGRRDDGRVGLSAVSADQ